MTPDTDETAMAHRANGGMTMDQIDTALNALIPIPSVGELKAADQDKLLQMIDWLGRWTHEIDTELRLRYHAAKDSAHGLFPDTALDA